MTSEVPVSFCLGVCLVLVNLPSIAVLQEVVRRRAQRPLGIQPALLLHRAAIHALQGR